MSNKRDYYDILGVQKNSDKDEIKKAYRKLAMKYHPDKNPDNKEAESKFKEASEAAEVLLSDEKKSRYDQFGHAGVDGSTGGFGGGFGAEGFGDLGDIFGDIFGDMLGGGGRRRGGRSRGRPGNDLQVSMSVSFTEAAFGVEKNITINKKTQCGSCNGSGGNNGAKPMSCSTCNGMGEVRRQQGFFTVASTCPRCHGSGQMISDPCGKCRGEGVSSKKVELAVKVPAGIDNGQRLKLASEGDAGQQGGPAGDLYVIINVKTNEIFERDGTDVYCEVPLCFSQAALGDEIEVPTLSGKVMLKIQPGTQSGKKLRLSGKGITKLGGYGKGDQIVLIHVETPTKLNSQQKELFKQLSGFENGSYNPMNKGFFDRVKDLFQ